MDRPAAQVNYWCPVLRLASMRKPCENRLAKIKELEETYKRRGWELDLDIFQLSKCQECQGRKLEGNGIKSVRPTLPEPEVRPTEKPMQKRKITRTDVLEALERLGQSPTRRALLDELGQAGFSYEMWNFKNLLKEMEAGGLIVQTAGPNRTSAVTISLPRAPQAPEAPEVPAAPEVPMCKKHPERPAVINPQGHSVDYCEECFAAWGRQGKEKQMKNKEDHPTWARMLLDKFPKFDPTWPHDLQLKWFEGLEKLISILKKETEHGPAGAD